MSEWLERLFKTIDKMDASGFVSFFTEDASFKFGNAQAVCGKTNIQKTVADFFSNLKGLNHRIKGTWEKDDVIICEGEVTYTRLDNETVEKVNGLTRDPSTFARDESVEKVFQHSHNRKLTLPFVDIFRMKGELIADYRVYMDIGPLFK